MMRYAFISLLFFIFSCTETKTKKSDQKDAKNNKGIFIYYSEYNCLTVTDRCGLDIIKLAGRDTLVYVSSDEFHERYEEIHGKLIPINDSIFYVQCFRHLLLSIFEDHGFGDSLLFICDSELVSKNMIVEYENKKQEEHKIYATENLFKVNKNYFNDDHDKLKLKLDYPHPIVNENVELYALHHGGVALKTDKYFSDFYIIIDSAGVRSISLAFDGQATAGPTFSLKRFPVDGRFSRGRTLR